jgi:hypothetical protein
VVEALLVAVVVERRSQVEDDGTVLDGFDSSRAERSNVADALHVVHDRDRLVPGA